MALGTLVEAFSLASAFGGDAVVPSGAADPILPSALSGLRNWYKANNWTLTTPGAALQTWVDAGGTKDLAGITASPLIDATGVPAFNGTTETIHDSTGTPPNTPTNANGLFWVVAKVRTFTSGRWLFSFGRHNSSTRFIGLMQITSGGTNYWGFRHRIAGSASTTWHAGLVANSAQYLGLGVYSDGSLLYSITTAATKAELVLEGALGSAGVSDFFDTHGGTPPNQVGGAVLRANNANVASTFSDCLIYDFGFIGGTRTDAELEGFRQYLIQQAAVAQAL